MSELKKPATNYLFFNFNITCTLIRRVLNWCKYPLIYTTICPGTKKQVQELARSLVKYLETNL